MKTKVKEGEPGFVFVVEGVLIWLGGEKESDFWDGFKELRNSEPPIRMKPPPAAVRVKSPITGYSANCFSL